MSLDPAFHLSAVESCCAPLLFLRCRISKYERVANPQKKTVPVLPKIVKRYPGTGDQDARPLVPAVTHDPKQSNTHPNPLRRAQWPHGLYFQKTVLRASAARLHVRSLLVLRDLWTVSSRFQVRDVCGHRHFCRQPIRLLENGGLLRSARTLCAWQCCALAWGYEAWGMMRVRFCKLRSIECPADYSRRLSIHRG